jgi:hypothetical protein
MPETTARERAQFQRDMDEWKLMFQMQMRKSRERCQPPVDPEACPNCGCKPGDGYTTGCDACDHCIAAFAIGKADGCAEPHCDEAEAEGGIWGRNV